MDKLLVIREIPLFSFQIIAADVTGDKQLDIVAIDTSAHVTCYSATSGEMIWESEISGSSTAGARLADMNTDGIPDLIIAADDG